MSKDLPLWEDDESDVKLEYRLQYGHVLIATRDLDQVLKKMCNVFKLGKPVYLQSGVDANNLPSVNDFTLLSNDANWHFIFAQYNRNTTVFCPHFLFFNSRNWIRLSRKLNTILGYVHQDVDFYSYLLFTKGKYTCHAVLEFEGIRQLKMDAIECYFDKKLIYKVDEEKDMLTQELKDFIAQDVIIDIDENRKIRFKTPLSKNDYHEPDEVRHAIFRAKPFTYKDEGNACRQIRNPIDILIDKTGRAVL